MQPSDKRDFAIEIMKLTIAFSKNFDDKRAEAICNVFAEALSEFAIDEIQAATREQIRESRFFPSPHDLAVICRRHRRAAREAHEARVAGLIDHPDSQPELVRRRSGRGRRRVPLHLRADDSCGGAPLR